MVQDGEDCDDANANNDDGCQGSVPSPRRGWQAGVEAYDGNDDNDDGCSNTCTLCGDESLTRESWIRQRRGQRRLHALGNGHLVVMDNRPG